MWFGTGNGVTRYKRSKTKPAVSIVSVQTDKKYTDLTAIPPITSGKRVVIEYHAIDFKTHSEKRQYQCRITDDGLRNRNTQRETRITNQQAFEWTPQKAGTYIFEVQAIDRDLNYSNPASVILKVVPPWYLNGWIAIPSGGAILVFLLASTFSTSRYFAQKKQSRRLREQLFEQERQKNVALQKVSEEAEAAKRVAETANQAKSIFLASMSHDIRTPLNAVLGYAQILKRESDLQTHQRSAVETIERSGNHLLSLINDILDISKIESGQIELEERDFNLAQLIDELFVVFELRFEQKGIDFRLEWQRGKRAKGQKGKETEEQKGREQTENPIFVYGDEGKLRRVLMNLLANAVKFTETGEVILRISQSSSSEITTTVWESKPEVNYFTFEVIDTGVGIPIEKQARIFEPFTQSESRTKDRSNMESEGIGLGLAISKRYVEIMSGELAVESPPQVGGEVRSSNGSRFFFTVPIQMAPDEIASRAMAPSKGDSNIPSSLADGVKVKALVADDNQENLNVLSRMLEDIGVTVIIAENGEQALEIVRNERPDIVFMDIWMPVMDGLETAEQILKEFKEELPKLVAVSASALVHERQAYFEAGFDDFIAKPVNAQQIYDCLATILRVEYEYDDTKTSQIEFEKIVLPEDLLLRLKKAAEFREVTEIRELLGEVRQIEHGNLLAERLLKLTWDLDMDAILEILGFVEEF